MSTFLTKIRDCCGNVTVLSSCCTTPIILEYVVYEDKITFTARGDCRAEFRLYVDSVDTVQLIANVPYDYVPDCNTHFYKLVVLCDPIQETAELRLNMGCASTLAITKYELQDLDANENPEVYLEWELSAPCPLISDYTIWYRPVGGAFLTQSAGVATSYTLTDVPCGNIWEFYIVGTSICNTVQSPSVYLFTGLCPCASGVSFVSKTSGDCFDRYIDLLFIPPLGPLQTVTIYRKLLGDPDASYTLIGYWASNPFSDTGVTIGVTYTYKAVITGANCLAVELTTDQTCIPDDCCDSCTLSVVSNICYVTATFSFVNCCDGVVHKLYRDDGINPEVDLGVVVSPFDDYTIEPDTMYTYYLRGEGDCVTTECSDTITTDCFLEVTNSGDTDEGVISQPHLVIVTFNITVPACCLPDTAVWNSTSPFLNILTAPTPLVAGLNVCLVSANINGAPAGPDSGIIFVTTGCDICGDDDIVVTWEV